MNGSPGRFQLLIAWINQETEERSTSWESFEQINKDAPILVKEFFRTLSDDRQLTYDLVLQSEIEFMQRSNRGGRGGRGYRGRFDGAQDQTQSETRGGYHRGGFQRGGGRGFYNNQYQHHVQNGFRGGVANQYAQQNVGTEQFDIKKWKRLQRFDYADRKTHFQSQSP